MLNLILKCKRGENNLLQRLLSRSRKSLRASWTKHKKAAHKKQADTSPTGRINSHRSKTNINDWIGTSSSKAVHLSAYCKCVRSFHWQFTRWCIARYSKNQGYRLSIREKRATIHSKCSKSGNMLPQRKRNMTSIFECHVSSCEVFIR